MDGISLVVVAGGSIQSQVASRGAGDCRRLLFCHDFVIPALSGITTFAHFQHYVILVQGWPPPEEVESRFSLLLFTLETLRSWIHSSKSVFERYIESRLFRLGNNRSIRFALIAQ